MRGEAVPADSRQADFDRHLADRSREVAQLPSGTQTVLDLPYVASPVQGSVPGSSQTLDLYVPPGAGPFPLVVWIHGGAWKGGDKNQEGPDLALRWGPSGIAVAAVDYRFFVDGSFPGMFQDCIDAVAFLRAHAAAYRLDPSRIGVMGISAGAHIAGVVAMAEGGDAYANLGPAVRGAVLLCGFYDMTKETGPWKSGGMVANPRDDYAMLYPGRVYDPGIAKKASPVYLVRPDVPPVLIVRGDKDATSPEAQSMLLFEALKKNGTKVKLSTYPDYAHNLWHDDVLAEALAFFKERFRISG